MPLSWQIRSNSTGPLPGPNRPVNTLPLSVRIPSGTPWRRSAPARASHRSGRSPPHHFGHHTETPMVIEASHHRAQAAISQTYPAHEMQLPQCIARDRSQCL